MKRHIFSGGLFVVMALGLSACGDTWRGLKKDTTENVRTVKQGARKADTSFRERTDLGPREGDERPGVHRRD